MANAYTPSARTTLKRKAQRGSYDADLVHAILDAGLVAHVGYVEDGQPVVTPTTYWREGSHLYWHGSAAGRALRAQVAGGVCFSVSLVDGLVLARTGFTHSMLYRSVMAYGTPQLVDDPAQKRRAMDAFLDRLYPGRVREIRPAKEGEIAATAVVTLALEEVSAKVRGGGAMDTAADMDATCWAGVVPLRTVIGEIATDAHVRPGTPVTPALAKFVPGTPVEAALLGRGDP